MAAEAVLKSGYLVKLDVVSQRTWKKRFFVLTDTMLHYYENEQNMAKPKGSVLIVHDSSVKNTGTEGGKNNCFNLCTPFTELHLSADSDEEALSWIDALENAIKKTKDLPRGYITKRGGIFDGGNRRKYFIMHSNAITWHADHEHVKIIQGTMPLLDSTIIEYADSSYLISLKHDRETLQLQFDQNDTEAWSLWKTSIQSIFGMRGAKLSGRDAGVVAGSEEGRGSASGSAAALSITKAGELHIRPPRGADTWPLHTVQLTNKSFEVLEADPIHPDQMTVVHSFVLTLSCAAFETNLGTHAFEIVTPTKVLHLRADSKEDVTEWIRAIREVILRSRPDPADPLFHQAMLKINDDVIYEVIFPESKPLGIVLERAGEWGVVKISNVNDTHVHVGSVLTAVNSQSVILYNYVDTIGLLRGWKPPLKLVFRKAPEKSGYLLKQSTGKSSKSDVVGRNWKKRFVVLKEGRLIYRESSDPNSALKGDLPLMGSAVSLVSSHEVGKFYCFRLVSGVTSLVMQAESVEEMMDWASTLYHASFIANGGNHIVGLQRARAAHERRKQREAEEKAAAEVARLAAIEEAEKKQREEEEAERQRRELLQSEELANLQAEDSEKQGSIDAVNAALEAAVGALSESTTPTTATLEALKSSIEGAKAMGGANTVLILQGELLLSKLESEYGEQLRLLAQIDEALRGNTVGLLSNVLVEVDMLPGFEDENHELLVQVKNALSVAKQRDTVIVMLAEAVGANSVDALAELVSQAKELGLQSETVAELASAEEMLKAASGNEAGDGTGAGAATDKGSALAAVAAAAAESTSSDEPTDAVASLASMSLRAATVKDSDDEGDSDDEVDDAEAEAEKPQEEASSDDSEDEDADESGDMVGELRNSADAARDSFGASSAAASSNTTGAAKSRSASLYVTAGATSAAATRFAEFEAAAKKDVVLPPVTHSPGGAATDDGVVKSLGPKKAMRRGSAVTYKELIIENKRANAVKHKAAEDAKGPKRQYASTDLATEDDIRRMFHSYAKSLSDLAAGGSKAEFLNPMQFATIFRLVTGQQGNLYKELQMFNKFDVSNNAALSESDFVSGWIKLSQEEDHQDYLFKIKSMVGEDNLML